MIPKTLRVTRDRKVMVKNVQIGIVEKESKGWRFQSTHEIIDGSLVGTTVKSIKEQITKGITRDAYVELVESQPDV